MVISGSTGGTTITTVSAPVLPLAGGSGAADPVAASSARVERRRVIGRLLLTTRGLALREAGGLIWFLDVDSTPTELLGTFVLVEGKRTGLTRLKVDYLGRSQCRGRLQGPRLQEAGR